MEVHNISVTEDYEEIRIDKYLADFFPDYSRSYIQQLIKDNMHSTYPEVIATERPDRVSNYLIDRKNCYFS